MPKILHEKPVNLLSDQRWREFGFLGDEVSLGKKCCAFKSQRIIHTVSRFGLKIAVFVEWTHTCRVSIHPNSAKKVERNFTFLCRAWTLFHGNVSGQLVYLVVRRSVQEEKITSSPPELGTLSRIQNSVSRSKAKLSFCLERLSSTWFKSRFSFRSRFSEKFGYFVEQFTD